MEIAGDGTMKCNQLFSGIRVLCAAACIFGTIPALAALADEPAAMATTLYAEEPPPGPQLSDEEREALDRKNSGQSMTEAQKDAATRAEKKLDTAEKYQRERNKQKQRGQPRRRR
jgi:hypothetical protein